MKSKQNVKLNTVDSKLSCRSSFSDIIWPNWEWVNKKIVQCTDVLLYNKLKIIKMVTNGIKCFNFIITFNKYIFILSIYHTYIVYKWWFLAKIQYYKVVNVKDTVLSLQLSVKARMFGGFNQLNIWLSDSKQIKLEFRHIFSKKYLRFVDY